MRSTTQIISCTSKINRQIIQINSCLIEINSCVTEIDVSMAQINSCVVKVKTSVGEWADSPSARFLSATVGRPLVPVSGV